MKNLEPTGLNEMALRIFLALASLVLAFSLINCGGSKTSDVNSDSPEKIVQSFFNATLSGDLKTFSALMAPEISPDTHDLLLQAFSSFQKASDKDKDEIRVTQLSTRTISSNTVEVDAVFKAGDPNTLILNRSGDTWRIVAIR